MEEGTITAAAARLGLSKAVVSKQLQLLEEELGVALLLRNTRRIQPSEAGRTFYSQAKAALVQAYEAFDTVAEHGTRLKGKLRITAPVDFGMTQLAPLIARFREVHPSIELELSLGDAQVDIIEQRFDLAFRIGWLRDSSNLARKLGSFSEIVVCAPRFLTEQQIAAPEDLQSLPFIANQVLDAPTRWSFERDGEVRRVELRPAITMNNTMAIREAAMTGACFAILPDFLIVEELATRRLTRLVADWSLRAGGVYVVSPPGRLRSRAAHAFLDTVQREIPKAISGDKTK